MPSDPQQLAKALLTYRSMAQHMQRNYPEYTPMQNIQESMAATPVGPVEANEAAAYADPLGANMVQRLLGMELSPMVKINEAFGVARHNPLIMRTHPRDR